MRSLKIVNRDPWLAYCRANGFNPNGAILYRGPSQLDGSPIAAIATGLVRGSDNDKTGAMIQIFILADVPESPPVVARARGDGGICGDCPHRYHPKTGKRTCYVTLMHGPRAVHAADQRGRYSDVVPWARIDGRSIRFGTYGDPAAVPAYVWERVARHASNWTGYTHQWRHEWARDLGAFLMASVDSEAEATEAWKDGLRTFRVRAKGAPLLTGEIDCPAYRGVSCKDCGLCCGNATAARSISIEVHGSGAGAFGGVE